MIIYLIDVSKASDVTTKMSENDSKEVQKCQKNVSDRLVLKDGIIEPLLVSNDDIGMGYSILGYYVIYD